MLLSWGRAGAGDWWACVAGVERVDVPDSDYPQQVLVTAWIPAPAVAPIASENYSGIPRIELPTDTADWPAPEIDPYIWRWRRRDYGKSPDGIGNKKGTRRRE